MKELSLDAVFDKVGHLGYGQLLYVFILGVLQMFIAFHMLLNIFVGLEPQFECVSIISTTTNKTSSPLISLAKREHEMNLLDEGPLQNVSLMSSVSASEISEYKLLVLAALRSNAMPSNSASESLSLNVLSSDLTVVKQSGLHTTIVRVRQTQLQEQEEAEEHKKRKRLKKAEGMEKKSGGKEEQDKMVLENTCPGNDAHNCRLLFKGGYVSFAQEWGLVCEARSWAGAAQGAWMAGVLVGAGVLAGLADKLGRRRALLLALIATTTLEALASLAASFQTFLVLRFGAACWCALLILAAFVWSQELVGARRRALAGSVGSVMFSLGIVLLSAIAAAATHWRTLTLLCSVVGLPFVPLILLVPESPRWLAAQGRHEEARQVFLTIARLNGTTTALPSCWCLEASHGKRSADVSRDMSKDRTRDRSRDRTRNRGRSSRGSSKERGKDKSSDEPMVGISGLMQHRYTIEMFLILLYSWFVNSTVYYGLTLAAGAVGGGGGGGGSVYAATAANGIVEVPACLVVVPLIERFGRRRVLVLLMSGGGLACCCLLAVPEGAVAALLFLSLTGKLCISASFSVLYIHTAEVFPTVCRNTGMGAVSVAARFGGIVCPFLLLLGDHVHNLHYAVLGALALSSGLLNLRLPETLGRPVPETIADILALADPQVPPPAFKMRKALDGGSGGGGGEEAEAFLCDADNLESVAVNHNPHDTHHLTENHHHDDNDETRLL